MDRQPVASFAEIRQIMREVPGPDLEAASQTAAREAVLTKPTGALARLEEITQWLATWQGKHPPTVNHPRVAVFAGNHGVADLGVSAYLVKPFEEAELLRTVRELAGRERQAAHTG